MPDFRIQDIFRASYSFFCKKYPRQSEIQRKTAHAIIRCKSDTCGRNISVCSECGHTQTHYNSCRSRHCPNCQAVNKEIWVDKRRTEVIDSPYFHVVFTLPHELNPLLYANQRLLYGLLHKCCAQTLLELSSSPKYLGATPGIIQVLHTWNQEAQYHVHMHCIISGGGLTHDRQLKISPGRFFIPVAALRNKFRGKFLAMLNSLYMEGRLVFPSSRDRLRDSYEWREFRDKLYDRDWCPYIKETFNGFGNAIEYLGRYTHKIAVSNSRIISVTDTETSFGARGRKPGEPKRVITLPNEEFIRRYLTHVLPMVFRKSVTMDSSITGQKRKT